MVCLEIDAEAFAVQLAAALQSGNANAVSNAIQTGSKSTELAFLPLSHPPLFGHDARTLQYLQHAHTAMSRTLSSL